MNIEVEKIIKLRKSRGLTIRKFADLLGITTRTVYNWENGNSVPAKSYLLAIANILNVKVNDIADLEDNPIFYSKPQLVNKEAINILNDSIDRYKEIPTFSILPLIEVKNENSRLVKENRRLYRNLQRYIFLMDSIDMIIYIKDKHRIIKKYNKHFLNLLPDDLNEEDISGCKFSDIFSRETFKDILQLENEAFKKGNNISNRRVSLPGSDNDNPEALASITPVVDNNNQVIEIIVSIKEIAGVQTSKQENILTECQ